MGASWDAPAAGAARQVRHHILTAVHQLDLDTVPVRADGSKGAVAVGLGSREGPQLVNGGRQRPGRLHQVDGPGLAVKGSRRRQPCCGHASCCAARCLAAAQGRAPTRNSRCCWRLQSWLGCRPLDAHQALERLEPGWCLCRQKRPGRRTVQSSALGLLCLPGCAASDSNMPLCTSTSKPSPGTVWASALGQLRGARGKPARRCGPPEVPAEAEAESSEHRPSKPSVNRHTGSAMSGGLARVTRCPGPATGDHRGKSARSGCRLHSGNTVGSARRALGAAPVQRPQWEQAQHSLHSRAALASCSSSSVRQQCCTSR